MNDYSTLLFSLRSLSVYRGVLADRAVRSLMGLLEASDPLQAADCYGALLDALQQSGLSLCDAVYSAVLYDDNAFTRAAARGEEAGGALLSAARHDLRALGALAYLTPGALRQALAERFPACAGEAAALPDFAVGHAHYLADESDWANELGALRDFCAENGYGDAARLRALAADEKAARELCRRLGAAS